MPEYLELRYHRGLRALVGAFWSVRLCIYLGILLNIAGTAAVDITGWNHYVLWLLAFSAVSILYSAVGGAWAVAIMDSVQFLVMLAGLLILFPIVMTRAGGLPQMIAYFRSAASRLHYVQLVPAHGQFNWVFVLAILLLSIKWACIDQSILQRAFGARSPRVGARGMVLSGLITTPMAFLWILPGLAAARLHPTPFHNPNDAIPWLLSTQLPAVGRGLLGFVLCGLVAAQISVITADVNSVATLLSSDVYRTLRRTEPSSRELLRVVRMNSLACGAVMILVALLLVRTHAGAIKANLAMVGILDMPLFVVTVIYGMAWKRTNWQGAVAGFIAGGLAGVWCYRLFAQPLNLAPIISSCTALVVTPLVSFLFAPPRRMPLPPRVEDRTEAPDDFHLVPRSIAGKIGAAVAVVGLLVFLFAVISASWQWAFASALAVGSMVAVILGGLVRVYVT